MDTTVPGLTTDRTSITDRQIATLLVDTAAGDRAAFRKLYSLTSSKLFGICLKLCANIEEAEIILVDVYSSIYTHAKEYGDSGLTGDVWLSRLAIRHSIEWMYRPSKIATSDEDQHSIVIGPQTPNESIGIETSDPSQIASMQTVLPVTVDRHRIR